MAENVWCHVVHILRKDVGAPTHESHGSARGDQPKAGTRRCPVLKELAEVPESEAFGFARSEHEINRIVHNLAGNEDPNLRRRWEAQHERNTPFATTR